jgi:uncharacterized membrane protein
MQTFLGSTRAALAWGLVLSIVLIAATLPVAGADGIGSVSLLLRWLHIVAVSIWIGCLWVFNLIYLAALDPSDDGASARLMQQLVPRVVAGMRHASHLSLITGGGLLLTTGYVFDRLVFNSAVYIAPVKMAAMSIGAIAGVVMWVIVNAIIAPGVEFLLTDTSADPAERQVTQARVEASTRLTILLVLPVMLSMVAAAHFY